MRSLLLMLMVLGSASASRADEVKLAVAANFNAAMKEIAAGFERANGHTVVLSFGSSGGLYAQIVNGAPYEVLLSADQKRPEMLEAAGVASGRFTYAVGKLALWSADPNGVDGEGRVLAGGDFRRLAIANPKTAPYGAAAVEALRALGLYELLEPRLVIGNSIAQTYQFVVTGNAALGFVSLAQIALDPKRGSRWVVPEGLYAPIRQDAVLLARGADSRAAAALIDYLKGAEARAVIERYGYGVE